MNIKKKLLSIVPFGTILIVCVVLLRSFVMPGIPQTHDGNIHLDRLANFYLAIHDHSFPPRWAPNLNFQYGYPVFNFMYYLPYIPGALFFMLGFSLETAFKLVTFFGLLSGGAFFYLWLKNHVSRLSALVGAVLFITAPPQLLQIFVRGNIGETVGYAVVVLCLYAAYSLITALKRHKNLAFWWCVTTVSVFLLLLSHNVAFLLGVPLVLGYALTYGLQCSVFKSIKQIFVVLSAVIVGIGLGGYYLLPAALEAQYTIMASINQTKDFLLHFPTLWQLFFSPWGYGYSVPGSSDGMSFQLGVIPLGVMLVLVGWLLYLTIQRLNGKHHQLKKIVFESVKQSLGWYFGFILVLSLFLMLEVSSFVWSLVPWLQQIQFPWRLLVPTTLALCIVVAFLLDVLKKKYISLTVLFVSFVLALPLAKPHDMFHNEDIFYFESPFTASVSNENLPIWFDTFRNTVEPKFNGNVAGVDEPIQFTQKLWKTQLHTYTITATNSATVVERVAYFPGWKTYVDGKEVKITYDHPDYPGVNIFSVSEGSHDVVTQLTEDTPARRWGNTFSVGALVILSLVITSSGVRYFLKKRYL